MPLDYELFYFLKFFSLYPNIINGDLKVHSENISREGGSFSILASEIWASPMDCHNLGAYTPPYPLQSENWLNLGTPYIIF